MPKPSMGAPDDTRAATACSSRLPLAKIVTSDSPPRSRIRRTRRACSPRSPLSSRTPRRRMPSAASSRARSTALAAAFSESKVSSSSTTSPGRSRAKSANACASLSWARTYECAIVPWIGIPKRAFASRVAVPSNPPTYAARAASNPASAPCARRRPKSTSSFPDAASTQRAAFEATSVSKCSRLTSRVSTSCASGSGAITRNRGSSGKHTVPSRMASTSPVNRRVERRSTKASSNRPDAATQASSSGVARSASRYSTTCSRPAATRKPRAGGSERTKNSNTAVSSMPRRKYECSMVSW